MTIKSASATLSSSFLVVARTGFVYLQEGQLDLYTGTIKPTGTGTWAALTSTTWDNFKGYNLVRNPIKWTMDLIDIGTVGYFTLNIAADFDGSLKYIIHVSETGEFVGEETEHYIVDGDLNVSAFYGRYVYITAFVTGNELRRVTTTFSDISKKYYINNVDSSTLAGTNTARQIEMPTEVSAIIDVYIQPKAAQAYAVNLYVSDTATSEIVIPVVKSKGTTATFALYGIDNDPRDAVVDIVVSALPRMVMYNGNLITQ